MKRFLISAAITAATLSVPALATDVGVSISIGQPGFYGQLDIGDFPQPRVLYSQPIIVERGVYMNRPPVYLRVPPGYAKNWKKHCHEYNACNERVLFVNDNWYEREYVPRYQEQHRDRGHDYRDNDRGDDHGNKGHGNKHDRD